MDLIHALTVATLLAEALAEDAREGGRFDADGFSNFFPEEGRDNPDLVAEAWRLYQAHYAGDA